MLCSLLSPASAGVVLLYHHVDDATPAITSIAPSQFQRHLDIIESEGFTVLPLDELVRRSMSPPSTGQSAIDEKLVAITFDDAYRSIYTTAFPMLRKRGWPFTVFVATDPVEQNQSSFITWAELNEMHAQGATIANHTESHAHLIRRQASESDDDWQGRVAGEILTAKDLLRENGFESNLFAYPYGEYNKQVLDLVDELGMIGFGQQSGAIGPHSNPLLLPRYPLAGAYVGEAAFRDKLRSLPMPVTDPDLEPLVTDTFKPPLPLTFVDDTINLSRLTCYGPGGLMALSESETETGHKTIIATPMDNVSIGRSRYNCTLPRGNRFYWFSQLWIRKLDDGSWYYEP